MCSVDPLELEKMGDSSVSRRSAAVVKKKENKRKVHWLRWHQYAGLGGLIIFAGMQRWGTGGHLWWPRHRCRRG